MTSGNSNTAIGAIALKDAHAGESENIAIGVEAMRDVDEDTNNADYNIAIGSMALKGGTLGGNFIGNIGYRSLDATGANGHTGTIVIGYNNSLYLTSGGENLAIGYQAMKDMTTGGCIISLSVMKRWMHSIMLMPMQNIAIGNNVLNQSGMNAIGLHSCVGIGHNAFWMLKIIMPMRLVRLESVGML